MFELAIIIGIIVAVGCIGFLGSLFNFFGQKAAAEKSAKAIIQSTQMQIDAMERQLDRVYEELDPAEVGPEALAADIERAKNRLVLQGIVDPDLLKTRYAAAQKILGTTLEAGQRQRLIEAIGMEETLAGVPAAAGKPALIAAAIQELEAGATLPPDVQQELIRAGLQRIGAVTGQASAVSASPWLQRFIGSAALDLQAQRQQRAALLLSAAQQLESARSAELAKLGSMLSAGEAQRLNLPMTALQLASQELPEAGLGGQAMTELRMARVGAGNQLSQSVADAMAKQTLGLGTVQAQQAGAMWQSAAGAAAGVGNLIAKLATREVPTASGTTFVTPTWATAVQAILQ